MALPDKTLPATTILGFNWGGDPTLLPEHVQFIRNVDWEATPMGYPSQWPYQLRQFVDFVLADPAPAALLWGDSLTMIYNEHFVEFAGGKHPSLMGKSPVTEYAEVWPMFVEIIERGKTTGKATRHKDVQLFLNRHGYLEECYVTYTFVPIIGPERTVVGFYHTALETTNEVLFRRRTKTLLAIGEAGFESPTLEDYWKNLLQALGNNSQDMPWVLAYSCALFGSDEPSSQAETDSFDDEEPMRASLSPVCTLAGAVGKSVGTVPLGFDRRDQEDHFVQLIKTSLRYGKTMMLRGDDPQLPSWVFEVTGTEAKQHSRTALLVPIRTNTRNITEGQTVVGFLVVGLAASREYDKEYEFFAHLLKFQLAVSAVNIIRLEREIRHEKQMGAKLSIADRQKIEFDLERKLSRFADVSTIGMWISSATGELLYANRAWYEQAGLSFNTPGMSVEKWMPLVTPESIELFSYNWAQLMEHKKPVTFECQFRAAWRYKDPSTKEVLQGKRWFIISAFPEFDEDGSLLRSWGCNVDVSHQKWAQNLQEQRLNEIMEAKHQSEKFIDSLTSHELRNPLSAILHCADSIVSTLEEAGPLSQDLELDAHAHAGISDSATTIISCAQHQKRLLDDILTVSKLDASLLEVVPCEVDPVATVHHALQIHQLEMKNKNIEGSVQVDKSYLDLGIEKVLLDPIRLLQILINLIANSIKFTQYQDRQEITLHIAASSLCPGSQEKSTYFLPRNLPKGRVTPSQIRGAEGGTGDILYLCFAVEDTGCGMSEGEIRKLFTRFTQASPKTHIKYGGSGLGLFICKELTELQGGRIGVESTSGVGSTFRFYVQGRKSAPRAQIEVTSSLTTDTENMAGWKSDRRISVPSPESIQFPPRGQSPQATPTSDLSYDPVTLHVLVVEDNLINQKVMAKQLIRAGCIVNVANHGVDCLNFLATTTFAKEITPAHGLEDTKQPILLSVVLMDLEMPIMDGLTCVRRIREMQRTGELVRWVPVIAITANARAEQIQNAKREGMDDVVIKPFRIKELIPQMYSLIDKVSHRAL